MEVWFWSAVGGAVLAGVSNFYFKQAAVRNYNAELFSLYGGLISVVFVGVVVMVGDIRILDHGLVPFVAFLAGFIASFTNLFKVHALRRIDSTIYFPLFKLLAPGLAIVAGIVFFGESFNASEWTGMLLGLTVPLLLITRAENGRQKNLIAGVFLVLVTGFTSASSAALNKFATDLELPTIVTLFYASFGIFLGMVLLISYKQGPTSLIKHVAADTTGGLVLGAGMRAVLITISLGLVLYAFANGGALALVQTIHSLYILIPIVLSILLYNEHWNLQKAVAILLSIAALALLK